MINKMNKKLMDTLLTVCLTGAAASPLAISPFAYADDANASFLARHEGYLNNAEEALKEGNSNMAQAMAEKDCDTLKRQEKSMGTDPRFQNLVKRCDAFLINVDRVTKGEQKWAYASRELRGVDTKASRGASLGGFLEDYTKVLQLLKESAKAYPEGLKIKYGEKTGQQLLDSCQSQVDKAGKQLQADKAQGKAQALKGLQYNYKENWSWIPDSFKKAEATLAKKKTSIFDELDASRALYSIKDASAEVVSTMNRLLAGNEELKKEKLGNTTVAEVIAEAKVTAERAKKLIDANESRFEAASKAWDKKLMSSLKGDRKKVWKQQGSPYSYEGDHLDSEKRLKAASSAAEYNYHYSGGNGSCAVTYHFKGKKLARTERNPIGCDG